MAVHDKSTKIYQCDKCPKTYIRKQQLMFHMERHTAVKNDKCPQCDKCFINAAVLKNHIRLVHENEFIQVCDICAKVFKNKAIYEQHYKLIHCENTTPPVQCKICGSWMKHEISLRKHMRRHEQEANTYICNICGKESPNRGALLSHQKYVHFDERNHKCTVCEKAFKRAISLKEHMTTHTGDVLYNCSHCDKTFNSSGNMHKHRKKMHPVEWANARMKKVGV